MNKEKIIYHVHTFKGNGLTALHKQNIYMPLQHNSTPIYNAEVVIVYKHSFQPGPTLGRHPLPVGQCLLLLPTGALASS